MDIETVKYELVPYAPVSNENKMDMDCAMCGRLATFDVYTNWPGGAKGLWETVCSEECFNLFVLKDETTW